MYAFFILQTTVLEAIGELYIGPSFQLPLLNAISLGGVTAYDVLGFSQDALGLLSLTGIAIFATIRASQDPRSKGPQLPLRRLQPQPRLVGTGRRGAGRLDPVDRARRAVRRGYAPTEAAFISNNLFGQAMVGIDPLTLEWIGAINLVAHLAIVMAFLVFTLHSKHLHIITIAFQELTRDPHRDVALGKLTSEPIDLENMTEETVLGVGAIEQFTFDRFLDFQTCTECGRCQSQCPAWNTGKPLSPKMLIQDLRDHMYAKGPFLLGQVDEAEAGDVIKIPLVGDAPGEAAVIDYDVLWSCTTCGACVEECPSTSSTWTPSSTCVATRR
jgi:ferredoxin